MNGKKTISILGTEYRIVEKSRLEDKQLEDCRGYLDWTVKKIVIAVKDENDDCCDFEYSKEKTLRHEIIHAFIFESGLCNNTYSVDGGWATNEEMVDWFAIQSPKIFAVFKELDIL